MLQGISDLNSVLAPRVSSLSHASKIKETERVWGIDRSFDESQRHYAEWKRPVSKGFIWYDSIYDFLEDKTMGKRDQMVAWGYGWGDKWL